MILIHCHEYTAREPQPVVVNAAHIVTIRPYTIKSSGLNLAGGTAWAEVDGTRIYLSDGNDLVCTDHIQQILAQFPENPE